MKTRVIPVLLLRDQDVVKTVQFKSPRYIGDPINTIRILNEKEVDEVAILDTSIGRKQQGPDFALLADIAAEAFMPLSYGGGISSLNHARKLFGLGFEKAVVSTEAFVSREFLPSMVSEFGSSSVVACLDLETSKRNDCKVVIYGATETTELSFEVALEFLENSRVGEVIVQSVDRDGTCKGYDLDLIRRASESLSCQVVALGGAGELNDLALAVGAGASAVAAGSLFCFYGPRKAVLINYPERARLEEVLP